MDNVQCAELYRMITPRLTNCEECKDIQFLIRDIDKILAEMANVKYNVITLMLQDCVDNRYIKDLLHYKRILQYKYVNHRYACDTTIASIVQRVENLKHKR
jgi:hypothetical protein